MNIHKFISLILENEYIRVIDVTMKPGDSSVMHVHTISSLLIQLCNNDISSQLIGQPWVAEKAEFGKAWFKSFGADSQVHRILNRDSVMFHVNDVETLSAFKKYSKIKPLPYSILVDNARLLFIG